MFNYVSVSFLGTKTLLSTFRHCCGNVTRVIAIKVSQVGPVAIGISNTQLASTAAVAGCIQTSDHIVAYHHTLDGIT